MPKDRSDVEGPRLPWRRFPAPVPSTPIFRTVKYEVQDDCYSEPGSQKDFGPKGFRVYLLASASSARFRRVSLLGISHSKDIPIYHRDSFASSGGVIACRCRFDAQSCTFLCVLHPPAPATHPCLISASLPRTPFFAATFIIATTSTYCC